MVSPWRIHQKPHPQRLRWKQRDPNIQRESSTYGLKHWRRLSGPKGDDVRKATAACTFV